MFEGRTIEIEGDFCRIGWEYFGEYSYSPNRHYLTSWTQNPSTEIKVENKQPVGLLLLATDNKVSFVRALRRPECGKVADNGTTLINDLIDFESKGSGIFVHDSAGNRILYRRFRAIVGCNGISADGRYCACQTYVGQYSDGDKLHCIRVDSGEILFATNRHLGFGEKIEILPNSEEVRLIYRDGTYLSYDLAGGLRNEEVFERILRDSAVYDPYGAFNACCLQVDRLASGELSSLEDCEKVITGLQTAIGKGLSEWYQARAFRMIGELQLRLNRDREALNSFENALARDEGVGVKRAITKLRKQLP